MLIAFTHLLLPIFSCYSQSLEGEWKGEYLTIRKASVTSKEINHPISISIKFIRTDDSSYNVFSYTKLKNDSGSEITAVCKLKYKMLPKNSIYLEETEVILPSNNFSGCLQKMNLKMKTLKQKTILEGSWECSTSLTSVGRDSGRITLTKQD